MNIRDIVREYLVTHGYDGLTGDADWDSCGCGVDDLMPCGDPNSRCQPALKALVPEPFEWEVEPGYWPRRWNGDRVQAMDDPGEIAWSDTSVVETAAFNAGRRYERERGHADE